MGFDKIERPRIYKHTMLNQQEADRVSPLMESAFASELAGYNHGNRQAIAKERVRFASEQYANRCRVSRNMGMNPLNEDANIFGTAFPQLKNLFESVAQPGNIIGLGEVTNPMNGNQVAGGMWNAGYKPGSGDVPSYVFGLQSQIALHCIGFDLIPTIAVDTPKVVISYVDTVYGGGTFNDKDNMPSFVEIASPLFTRAWIKKNKLERAKTHVLISDGTDAIECLFILGSTIKAALTVEVLGTGTGTAAGTDYVKKNEKSVKEIIDNINKTKTGKVCISLDGTVASYAAAVTADMKQIGINYASQTRQNIAEAASNDNSLGGMSRATHEKGPKHKLNVIMMDKQLEMVGLEIEADTTNIQIKDMASAGINVIAYLYSGVQNQLIQSIDEVILDHLYAMGVQHAVNVWESQGINYNLYIDEPSNTELDLKTLDIKFVDMMGVDVRDRMGKVKNTLVSAGYENQETHGQRLYARLLVILEFVAYQNRIAAPDFIVAGGELCACLKKQSTYSSVPVATTLSANPELHYAGTIFETVNVYKNPKIDFNDPRILFGRRGNDTDPGSKFIAYDLASSRQTIAEQTMSDKIRVWSRFAIADIGFYPELNYFTAVFINNYNWG